MATRSWGMEAQVSAGGLASRTAPRVAAKRDGGLVVAWNTQENLIAGVRATEYNDAGFNISGEVDPLEGTGLLSGSSAAVAALGAIGHLVAWIEPGGTIYVRTTNVGFYSAFQFGAGPSPANLAAAGVGETPVLAWEAGGEVQLALVNPAGTVTRFTVTDGPAQGTRPGIAVSPDEARIAVAWQDGDGLMVQLRTASGQAEGGVVTVVDPARGLPARGVQMTWLGNSTLAMVWDQAIAGTSAIGRDIMLRLYAVGAEGLGAVLLPLTDPIVANATRAGDQTAPQVAALPGGGLVVSWQSLEPDGPVVRLQAFDRGGARIGGEYLVSASGDDGTMPGIAAMADGRVAVAWASVPEGTEAGQSDILFQIIDPRQGIVTGTARGETLFGNDALADVIRGLDGDDTLRGLRGDDRLFGGNGNDTLEGGRGDDILSGGAGNDLLDGGSGGDDMYGGKGDDTFVLDSEDDQIFESFGEGTDTVRSAVFSINLGAIPNVENATLLGAAPLFATGTFGANVLDGASNSGANVLTGLGGNDIYIVGPGDTVVEPVVGGTDWVQGAIQLHLANYPNVENLRLTGTLPNPATGNSGANILDGAANTADNALTGLAGDDTYILGPGDTIVELSGGGTDTATSALISIELVKFANVENLTLEGALPLAGKGDDLANVLNGERNSAPNVLTGMGGNDTYVLGAGDSIVEAAGGGTDTATSSTTSINLGSFANVENATLLGGLPLAVAGNALANVLDSAGNGAKNILTGLGGNDIYVIGAGDTIVEEAGGGTDMVQSALVSLDLALFPNVENATLLGTSPLFARGTNADNVLNGANNTAANVLTGLGGNDTYGIGVGDTVVEADGGGADTVSSSSINIDLLGMAFVENATLTGSAPLSAQGNSLDNVLNGSSNTAANVLTGLGGNDTYIVGAGDTVVEAGSGVDTVQSGLISLNLAAYPNVENIVLTGGLALSATGNLGPNRIDGAQNTGANVLTGAGGDDTYVAGVGDTVVEVTGEGNDRVLARGTFTLGGGQSVEVIEADAGTIGLTLTGNLLAQSIFGGAGNDTLTGGGGGDTLIGNGGADLLVGTAGSADRFAFILPGDSPVGVGRDVIQGFKAAEGDRIDLQSIDANTALLGNQAFSFIGTATFTGPGQVHYFVFNGTDAIIQGTVSGTTAAFEIRVPNVTALAAGDFVL